jgi:hypothetical protein
MKRHFILAFVLIYSCVGTHKLKNASLTSKFVNFAKVKVKINFNEFENFSLKGNINIVKDSLICFCLWGPMGLKVLSGEFSDQFKIIDHYNGKEVPDIIDKLMEKSGIIFNRKVIETVLLAEVDSLKEVLRNLNKDLLQVDFYDRDNKQKMFKLLNKLKKSEINIEYNYSRSINKFIRISYKDPIGSWNVIIEIIAITNEKKKCNFG